MKLLIVGGDSDPNTRRVVDHSHMHAIDYLFWDTDREDCLNIAWDFDSADLDLGDNRLRPESIFMRWNVFGGESERNVAAYQTIQAYSFAWPDIRILNRTSLTDGNNKSFNLQLARQLGFKIPKTLVMSNLLPLTTMPDRESMIAKPLDGGAHTKQVSKLAEDEEALVNFPPQFIQEKLDGENLRVFAIGGELFCFQLVTSELDYREDEKVDVVQIPVPDSLQSPTKKLAAAKGFDYCALDFRCRQGLDDPVFLEVNSFPMFVRFDDAGNHCLVDAILKFLCIKK